jgi:cell division protease FtsH
MKNKRKYSFNNLFKNLLLWIIIVTILITVFSNFGPKPITSKQLTYSAFLKEVDSGDIISAVIRDRNIEAIKRDNTHVATYLPMEDQNLLKQLIAKGINVEGKPPEQEGALIRILISWAPMLIILGVWIFFMRQAQGGGRGGPLAFGRSKARLLSSGQIKITFKDVAGIDEAKEEVQELVDFLRDPGKFKKLGGKIPCGVLLVGAPGTGKTLLAKAVAGEAKVPFYSISGSDFVEMFVGVGASRVRDMFETAKKNAPCIIFIDEIDAVGRHRGAGLGGGHDEREQTLNQLLVEMDGFEGKEGVIVMAATNRPDVLDPALLRPGRFDRQVVVPLPDVRGREFILKVHMRKIPLDSSVNPTILARSTPGFSGADLANMVNEAALFAARSNKKVVDMPDFERAKDKIMMGAERRSMVMSEKEKIIISYHEAGHVIVSLNVPEGDPVYKVSIIARGLSLGVTMLIPDEEQHLRSKQMLESQITGLFGGRAAEEIQFGKNHITTGAANDIERATKIARNMITKWGLSEKLGPITYGSEEGEIFLGRSVTSHKEISDFTAVEIDKEVKQIVDRSYQRAKEIIENNREKLNAMVDALINYETLDKKQIDAIMAGKKPPKPKGWVKVIKKRKSMPNDSSDIKSKSSESTEEILEETSIQAPQEEAK